MPTPALAQAGCGGQALAIQALDDLLATAWAYLTSGALIRILAVASMSFGMLDLFAGRLITAALGLVTSVLVASLPRDPGDAVPRRRDAPVALPLARHASISALPFLWIG